MVSQVLALALGRCRKSTVTPALVLHRCKYPVLLVSLLALERRCRCPAAAVLPLAVLRR